MEVVASALMNIASPCNSVLLLMGSEDSWWSPDWGSLLLQGNPTANSYAAEGTRLRDWK